MEPEVPWFDPALRPLCDLHATLPVAIKEGSPVLPPIVLWALRLNEGDLLMVSMDEIDPLRLQLQSYLAVVASVCEGFSQPWTVLEEMIRRPMAALGPKGAMSLPDEAAAWRRPARGSLWLRADWTGRPPERSLALQVEMEARSAPHLYLEARYTLPVLPGFRVTLPADALWVLGLRGGDRLGYETSFAQVKFEPVSLGKMPERLLDLEPDGTLTLPDSLSELAGSGYSFDQVRLTVTFSPLPAFQIEPWTEAGIDKGLPSS